MVLLKDEISKWDDIKVVSHKKDEEGRFPFMNMILQGASNEEVKKWMVDHSVNSRDGEGNTPLMMAVSAYNTGAVSMLIDKGADLNLANQYGFTALHYAKNKRMEYLTEVLINLGAKDVKVIPINILNDVPIQEIERSPVEILKSRTFVMNPILCNKMMVDLYQHLEKVGDYRARHILKFIAFKILEEDNQKRSRLEIHGTNEAFIASLNGETAKGAYNYLTNKIYVSDIHKKDSAAKTLLHEMIHFVRRIKTEKDYKELEAAQKKVYERVEKEGNSKWGDYLQKEILVRAENGYLTKQDILEENISDMASVFLIGKANSVQYESKVKGKFETEGNLKELAKPLTDYFDRHMIPYMREFIKNQPYQNIVAIDENEKKLHKNSLAGKDFYQNTELKIHHHNLLKSNSGLKQFVKEPTDRKDIPQLIVNKQKSANKILKHQRVHYQQKHKPILNIRTQIL